MIINVDYDGVLVPNSHEELLITTCNVMGYSFKDTSPIWNWYQKLIETNPLPINVGLLQYLSYCKGRGDTVRLWTNRQPELRTATMNNLGIFSNIFDEVSFNAGHKGKMRIEGVVIDNDTKNLKCGELGVHYEWR